MFEFLATHPSLFIIGATIIIIILIFAFFTKKSTDDYKIEQIRIQSRQNEYIELQEIQADETDTTQPITPTLPVPKLSRKLRYDSDNQQRKPPHVYDTPRVQQYAAILETEDDENDNYEESTSSFSYDPIQVPQDTIMIEAGTSRTPNVVYREPLDTHKENRVSVSELHNHESYVSFDEFDNFDEFRNSCVNTLRLTVDFAANDSNYIVPVKEND